jgi:hypothetical protein
MLSGIDSLNELSRIFGRLFDIGISGLRSNTPLLSDESGILEHLKQQPDYEKKTAASEYRFSLSDDGFGYGNAENYLDNEITKLETVIKETVDFINNDLKDNNELPASLKKKIEEVDYTFLFFPDITEPVSDISFLRRFLFSASWFKDTVIKTRSIIRFQD